MRADLAAVSEVCLALRARRLARRVSRVYDAALAPLGLDVSQFNVLIAIGAAGPAPLRMVADTLDLDPSTLSRTLQPMRTAGLLLMSGGRGRGGLMLDLSTRGEELLATAVPAWRDAQSRITAALGESQVGRTLEAFELVERATL